MKIEKKIRILILEDNAKNIQLFKLFFKEFDWNLTFSKNGVEGLELIKSNPPDLLLLDLYIPGMGGFEILKEIKIHYKENHFPIIIISGFGTEIAKEQAFSLGADEFITKPIKWKFLINKIQSFITIH